MQKNNHSQLPSPSHSDMDLILIQKQYRHDKLKENLLGPICSTFIHIILLTALSFFRGEEKPTATQVVLSRHIEEDVTQLDPLVPLEKLNEPELSDLEQSTSAEEVKFDELADPTVLMNEDTTTFEEPLPVSFEQDADSLTIMKANSSSVLSNTMSLARSGDARNKALIIGCGTPKGQQSLYKALDWLGRNQQPNGAWGANEGVTSLVLLSFLAHGDTPKSKRYGATVHKAIEYLASSDPKNALTQSHAYPHALKVYALAEAYTMTGNYALITPLKSAADTLVKGQRKAGDFDYNYKQGARWDNSISFWNYQAMKALSFTGLEIPGLSEAIVKSVLRLKQMASYHFPYSGTKVTPAGRGNLGLASAGALCLYFYGEGQGNSDVKDILSLVEAKASENLDWNNSPEKWSMYAWYYQTFAMFQQGGKAWKKWAAKFEQLLMENQHAEGYWAHDKAWGAGKNLEQKAYQTAMASLMLTVYYRYSSFNKKYHSQKKTSTADEGIDIF